MKTDRMRAICYKGGCIERVHSLNSKSCKLCEKQVCLNHLLPEDHDCPKIADKKIKQKRKKQKDHY